MNSPTCTAFPCLDPDCLTHFDEDGEPRPRECVEDGDSRPCRCFECATASAEAMATFGRLFARSKLSMSLNYAAALIDAGRGHLLSEGERAEASR